MIALVIGQGGENRALALGMGAAIAVCAAVDVVLLSVMEARSRRR